MSGAVVFLDLPRYWQAVPRGKTRNVSSTKGNRLKMLEISTISSNYSTRNLILVN
jgi:hypothetical protein